MSENDGRGLYTWEENTERRLNIYEQKLDRLLDPETGIHAKLNSIEGRLTRFGAVILGALTANLLIEIVRAAG